MEALRDIERAASAGLLKNGEIPGVLARAGDPVKRAVIATLIGGS
jgi:hypothetical protein